jgi:hypothetical protein
MKEEAKLKHQAIMADLATIGFLPTGYTWYQLNLLALSDDTVTTITVRPPSSPNATVSLEFRVGKAQGSLAGLPKEWLRRYLNTGLFQSVPIRWCNGFYRSPELIPVPEQEEREGAEKSEIIKVRDDGLIFVSRASFDRRTLVSFGGLDGDIIIGNLPEGAKDRADFEVIRTLINERWAAGEKTDS